MVALPSESVPTWRSLNDASRQTKISKRTLQRWIARGLLRRYRIMGDPKAYVDLDEIKKLREIQPWDS
jgi:DNA-binding transcriptional MerR regulator